MFSTIGGKYRDPSTFDVGVGAANVGVARYFGRRFHILYTIINNITLQATATILSCFQCEQCLSSFMV